MLALAPNQLLGPVVASEAFADGMLGAEMRQAVAQIAPAEDKIKGV